MYGDEIIQEMIEGLQQNGEIRLTDGLREISIQALEEVETLYITSTNREFDDAEEAVQWVVEQLGGIENVEEWE
ncbi:hypothetical protein N3C_1214 [Clostridium sp. N3C]|uniref:hypothetical protein n=1 Tax=Clostridium sp. N3C TaxID=1776758 RepID=UPI00092E0423|nr:hypothetical protein [Clostridium sp. N3C]SCN23257.1 hypothetical protein N3C_1214 [Clostridium sp. N3C]